MKFDAIEPVIFNNGNLEIIDQTLLPAKEKYIHLKNREDVYWAIKKLNVRGAPAIGVCAAFGVLVDILNREFDSYEDILKEFRETKVYLEESRPTAVNLSWALNRMEKRLESLNKDFCMDENKKERVEYIKEELIKEATRIREEDIEACKKMGEYGLKILKPKMKILTHCNAGSLATAKYGTCLAPIYLGEEKGYGFKVYVDETRPLLQGARLTSFELNKAGVDVTLICDNMAATVMKNKGIDAVVVGCDRMAANGDGANKIGTYGLSILAKALKIPFYMFVPTSTIDLNTSGGDDIAIEERDGKEISSMWYKDEMAPKEVKKFNPAFDITPNENISAIITEKGICYPPFLNSLKDIVDRK